MHTATVVLFTAAVRLCPVGCPSWQVQDALYASHLFGQVYDLAGLRIRALQLCCCIRHLLQVPQLSILLPQQCLQLTVLLLQLAYLSRPDTHACMVKLGVEVRVHGLSRTGRVSHTAAQQRQKHAPGRP